MGKKKMPKKTKELSVAIAESSSMAEETQQQQNITPRKRGRPRKIVEKTESEEIQEAEEIKVEEAEAESKKAKMIGEEKEEHMKEVGATSTVAKESQPQRRGRARRKSKPRKSS